MLIIRTTMTITKKTMMTMIPCCLLSLGRVLNQTICSWREYKISRSWRYREWAEESKIICLLGIYPKNDTINCSVLLSYRDTSNI